MTDERDSRDQDAAPDAAPASDLPTPAEDRSAAADLAAGEASETEAGGEEQAAAGGEQAAAGGEQTAAGEERAAAGGAVEARAAAGGEGDGEPLGEAPAEAASEPAVAPGTGGGEGAPEEAVSAQDEEPPARDAVSVSEDARALADRGESREAPNLPSDVSAETSPVEEPGAEPAAEAPVSESEAEGPAAAATDEPAAASRPPDVSAETPREIEAPETAADAEPAARAEPQPSSESVSAPTTGAAPEAPATPAESPPSPESVSAPTAGAAPEAPAAAAAEPEPPEDPALAELRRAKEEGTTVEGKVIGWNRGGFHVVVGEVTAFCPSSEMELGRPRSPQSYVDRTLEFRVVKFQKKGRRVVLSRAAVLTEERQRVVGRLAPGAVVRGRVTSLPDFGAFVDLGGVEGLVHVSEISRGRVKNPKEALQLGQEVEVKVLKVEKDGERISLSMKDLEPDPWQGVADRYPRGEKLPGKVARRADFGLFVELEPEVEGLVHVSQLPPGTELGDPSLDPGREIEVWVREVDRKRQRISLSLREIPSEDPWKEAKKRFPEGEMVEGTVESIAPFGVFVNLAPGLTGLLPGSQTGLPKGTSAARAFTPGQTVRVQVLSIDPRRKRISLGREGSRVEATRTDLQDFKKQQREREQEAPTAMAAAFARLREERKGSDEG